MDATHGMALMSRVAAEHRRPLIVLGLASVAAVLTYALVVYPLAQRVANIEQRDRAAEQALAAAQTELARASGTLTGKARAATELETFYKEVLPRDLAAARRMTYLRLALLARETNLDYDRASYSTSTEGDGTLARLQIQMILSGTYADVRTFIYEIETAPEFVVIDNIQLGEADRETGTLVVTLELSTYYRGVPTS